jgi:hypothetical protein
MFKNKKGQTGIIAFILLIIAFVLVWAYALGSIFREWGLKAIAENSLTGIEALFFANINLVIGVVLLASILLMAGLRR